MIERIKQILRSNDLNPSGNVSSFARIIGMKQETVNNQLGNVKEGRQRRVSLDLITHILEAFPQINSEWLLRGTGEMLYQTQEIDESSVNKIYKPKDTERHIEKEVINIYDITAAANLKTLFEQDSQYVLDKIVIPNAPKCDGAIYVRGDSMYPLLKSGDIVAYKELPDLRYILWGEMYIVDLNVNGDDQLVVKYVQKSEKGEDYIKLVSYNQNHQPQDFHISCIRSMALVKLSIRMNTIN